MVDYLVNCLSGYNRRERRKGEEREEWKGERREEKREGEERRGEGGGQMLLCAVWHITLLCAELFVSIY